MKKANLKTKMTSLVLAIVMMVVLLPVMTINASAASFNIFDAVSWSNDNAETGTTLCAEFVADCLIAGGLEIDKNFTTYEYGCVGATIERCSTLFYYLRDKLGCEVIYDPSASQVAVGDVIMYDGRQSYNMTESATIGREDYDTIGHAAFVVEFSDSTPLINQHNNNWKQISWDDTNCGTKLLVKTSKLSGSSGGTTTIEAPVAGSIAISNATELAAIGKDSDSLSKNYHLIGDIDLSSWGEWTPIGTFTGTFDGQGYVIRNMKITGRSEYGGIFGAISRASIKNVGVENAYIDISYSDYIYAGGVCGYSDNGSSITNCYTTGEISASAPASSFVGGICGWYINGGSSEISNCYNAGKVSASSSKSSVFYPASYAGGICGEVAGGYINNCYNTGEVFSASVSSDSFAGGICGRFRDMSMSNCYNVGELSSSSSTANSYVGGICGGTWNNAELSNCYWNSDSIQIVRGSAQNPKKGVGGGIDTTTPLTSAQMKMQSSFAGFDFANVWEMVSDKDYPQLRRGMPSTLPPPLLTTYMVTISSAYTGATGSGSYEQGDTVNINAGTAPTGQRFKNWTATGGVTFANASNASTSFTMPANAVTITAVFEDISTDPEDPTNPSSKGHVLGNASIGIGDAQLAFRAALKLVDLTVAQLAAADLNGNGTVDMSEAMRIFRYALGLSNEL